MCTKYLLAAITGIQILGFPSFFTSAVFPCKSLIFTKTSTLAIIRLQDTGLDEGWAFCVYNAFLLYSFICSQAYILCLNQFWIGGRQHVHSDLNFQEVATSVLLVLNNVTRLDLHLQQNMLV